MTPSEIEKRSFEIIAQEMGDVDIDPESEQVVKRVIHTTADFDYLSNLYFSDHAVRHLTDALKEGATVVTDTKMALAGINKRALAALGGEAKCFIADEDVAREAKTRGVTRSQVSMEKAAGLRGPLVFAIGNAPTALIKICDLVRSGDLNPRAVIGVPVGFVNVIEAKEQLMRLPVPCIVARGRKGGSGVAAAIVNACLYRIGKPEG